MFYLEIWDKKHSQFAVIYLQFALVDNLKQFCLYNNILIYLLGGTQHNTHTTTFYIPNINAENTKQKLRKIKEKFA